MGAGIWLSWLVAVAAPPATLSLNPAQPGAAVNRRVLGTNDLGYQYDPGQPKRVEYSSVASGIWDPLGNQPVPAMVELAKQAGVSTLRWPGGCGTHLFRWKDTIGPLDQRPNQRFGLHEFMRRCDAVGAQPMITVAEYYGTAQDAADMVEYLNAPVGRNPGGGQDYAAVRAALGRPEPWHAVWFEFGNESDHGDHHQQRYTPAEYAARYHQYRQAMRAVDPTIKLGLVLANTTWEPAGDWTETVLKLCPDADFLIHHAYLPGYSSNEGKETAAQIYVNGFAVDAQFRAHYQYLDALVQRLTGRRIPFAITEYNGAFVQERPVPYRICHANALTAGLILSTLLDPRLPIDNAQYWQFSNEYWGAVKGFAAPYVLRPAYLMFTLFHRHLGERHLSGALQCATFDVPGGFGVRRMVGAKRDEERMLDAVPLGPWQIAPVPGAKQEARDGVLAVEITDPSDKFNYYHAGCSAPAVAGADYRLTAEVRTAGLAKTRGAQLQIGDGRGWLATHSCSLSPMVNSSEWTTVQVDYQTLPDTTSVVVQARRLEGGGAAGKLWYRNLKLVRFEPRSLGAQPILTCVPTLRADRGVDLLVFNKDLTAPTELTIRLPGARAAEAEALVAPALESTNEKDAQTVRITALGATVADGAVTLTLPPFSLSGVRIARD